VSAFEFLTFLSIHQKQNSLFKKYFFGVPHLAIYIFFLFQLLNEPELGAGIDPDMV